jgi:hypothetical protein
LEIFCLSIKIILHGEKLYHVQGGEMRKNIAILFIASLMLVATGIPAFADVPENTDTQGVVSKAIPMEEMSRNGNPICQCFCGDFSEPSAGVNKTNGVMLEPRNIHYPCFCECGGYEQK